MTTLKENQPVTFPFRNKERDGIFLNYSGWDSEYCHILPSDPALLHQARQEFKRSFIIVLESKVEPAVMMKENNPNAAFKLKVKSCRICK